MSFFDVPLDKEATFSLQILIKYFFFLTNSTSFQIWHTHTHKKSCKTLFLITDSKGLIHTGHRYLATEVGFWIYLYKVSLMMYMSSWPIFGPSLTHCQWGRVGQRMGKQVELWFVRAGAAGCMGEVSLQLLH